MPNNKKTVVPKKTFGKNLAKSIGYSSINVMKSFVPSISGTADSFHETTRELTQNVKPVLTDMKGTITRLSDGETGKTAKKLLASAWDDIKSGNISLPQEEKSIEDMYGSFDDYDDYYDDATEPNEANNSTAIMAKVGSNLNAGLAQNSITNMKGMKNMTETLANVQMKSSTASTAKITEAIMYNTNIMYNTLSETNKILHNIDSNIIGMSEFMNENISQTNAALMQYMENTEKLIQEMRDQNALTRNKSTYKYDFSDPLPFITDRGLDFREYAKTLKQKAMQSQAGSTMNMVSMLAGMLSGDMSSMIRIPQMALEEFIMPHLIPQKYQRGLRDIDKTFGQNIEGFLQNIGGLYDPSRTGIKGKVINVASKIFGLDAPRNKGLNMANYTRDEIGWNGIAQKSLVDVIPSYLSHIEVSVEKLADVTKADLDRARRFNYQSGKFMTTSQIRRDAKKRFESSISYDFSDFSDYIDKIFAESNTSTAVQRDIRRSLNEMVQKSMNSGSFAKKAVESEFEKSLGGILSNDQLNQAYNHFSRGVSHGTRNANDFFKSVEENMQGSDVIRTLNENLGSEYFDNTKKRRFTYIKRGFTRTDIEAAFRKEFPDYIMGMAFGRPNRYVDADIIKQYRRYTDAKTAEEREQHRLVLIEKIREHNSAEQNKRGFSNFRDKILGKIKGDPEDKTFLDDVNIKLHNVMALNRFKDQTHVPNPQQYTRINSGLRDFEFSPYGAKSATQRLYRQHGGIKTVRVNNGSLENTANYMIGGRGIQDTKDTSISAADDALIRVIPSKLDHIIAILTPPESTVNPDQDNHIEKLSLILSNTPADGKPLTDGQKTQLESALSGATRDMSINRRRRKMRIKRRMSTAEQLSELNDTMKNELLIITANSKLEMGDDTTSEVLEDEAEQSQRERMAGKMQGYYKYLFDLDTGKFKGASRRAKDIKDYAKYHITGKGYTDTSGNEYGDLENSVTGEVKKTGKKAFDYMMQYVTNREDYQNSTLGRDIVEVLKKPGRTLGKEDDSAINPEETVTDTIIEAGEEAADIIIESAQNTSDTVFGEGAIDDEDPGKKQDKIKKLGKKLTSGLSDKWKKLIPKIGAGVLIGGGLGLLSTIGGGGLGILGNMMFDGGPIAGAILGGGLLFLSSFGRVNKALFGEEDEDGEKRGGLISNKLQKAFKKSLPIIIGGGILGGIKGAIFGGNFLPGPLAVTRAGIIMNQLLPGGVIGGALLGVAAGFIKQSGFFQNLLFGDKSDESKDGGVKKSAGLINKIWNENTKRIGKKAGKAALIGAVTGLTLSKMGVIGSALSLGGPIGMGIAGLGMSLLSNSEKFQRLMYGEQEFDEEGNPIGSPKGGILGSILDTVKVNIGQRVSDRLEATIELSKLYAEKYIGIPFHRAVDPIISSIHDITANVRNSIDKAMDHMVQGITDVFRTITDGAFYKMTNLIGKYAEHGIDAMLNQGKALMKTAAIPLQMLGFLTRGIRTKKVRSVQKAGFDLGMTDLRSQWAAEDEKNGEKPGFLGKLARYSDTLQMNRKGWRQYADDNYANLTPAQQQTMDMLNYGTGINDQIKAVKNRRKTLSKVDTYASKFMHKYNIGSTDDITDELRDEFIAGMNRLNLGQYYDMNHLQTGKEVSDFIFNRDDWKALHQTTFKDEEEKAKYEEAKLQTEEGAREHTINYQEKMQENSEAIIQRLDTLNDTLNTQTEVVSGGSFDSTNPADNFESDGSVKDEIVDEAIVNETETSQIFGNELNRHRQEEAAREEAIIENITEQRKEEAEAAREEEETKAARSGATSAATESQKLLEGFTGKSKSSSSSSSTSEGEMDVLTSWILKALGLAGIGTLITSAATPLVNFAVNHIIPALGNVLGDAVTFIWSKTKDGANTVWDALTNSEKEYNTEEDAANSGKNYYYDEKKKKYVVLGDDTILNEKGKKVDVDSGILYEGTGKFIRNAGVAAVKGSDNFVKYLAKSGSMLGTAAGTGLSGAGAIGRLLKIPGVQNLTGTKLGAAGGSLGSKIGKAGVNAATTLGDSSTLFKRMMYTTGGGTASKLVKSAGAAGSFVKDHARSSLLSHVSGICEKILKLGDNSVLLEIFTKNGFSNSSVGKVLTKLTEKISKTIASCTDNIAKYNAMIAEATTEAAAKTGTGLLSAGTLTAIFAAYDLATGAFEADKLFNIESDEVTGGMRVISSLFKMILGLGWGPIFDIIIDICSDILNIDFKAEVATGLYKFLVMFSPDGSERVAALEDAQEGMELEALVYNAENDTNLTAANYSELKDRSAIRKVWDAITGKSQQYDSYSSSANILAAHGFSTKNGKLYDSSGNEYNLDSALAAINDGSLNEANRGFYYQDAASSNVGEYGLNNINSSGMYTYQTNNGYGQGPVGYGNPMGYGVDENVAYNDPEYRKMTSDREIESAGDAIDELMNSDAAEIGGAVVKRYEGKIITSAEKLISRRIVKKTANKKLTQATNRIFGDRWKVLGSSLAKEITEDADSLTRVMHIVDAVCRKIKKIMNNEIVRTIAGKFGLPVSKITTFANLIIDGITSMMGKCKEDQAKVIEALLEKAAVKLVTKTTLKAVFTVYDTIQGMLGANILFNVEEDEVTPGMVFTSSLMNVLLGSSIGTFVAVILDAASIINGVKDYTQILANQIYGLFCKIFNTPEAIENLENKQNEMKLETIIYNMLNDTDYNFDGYAALKDATILGTIKNLVTGRKSKLKTANEYAKRLAEAGYSVTDDIIVNSDNEQISPRTAVSTAKALHASKKSATTATGAAVGYGFAQNDPRWANYTLGKFSNGKTSTMATGGCGPTALAQVAGVNPVSVAKMAKTSGYISDGGANASLMTSGARKLGLQAKNAKGTYYGELQKGKPVVISGVGSRKSSPFTSAGHIVTATGVTKNGGVVVSDPMTGKKKVYNKKTIDNGLTGAWAYSKRKALGYGPLDMTMADTVSAAANKATSTVANSVIDNASTAQRTIKVTSGGNMYSVYNKDGSLYKQYKKDTDTGAWYEVRNGIANTEDTVPYLGWKFNTDEAMKTELIALAGTNTGDYVDSLGRYHLSTNKLESTDEGQTFLSTGTASADNKYITTYKTGIYDPARLGEETPFYAEKYKTDDGIWSYAQRDEDWANLKVNGATVGGSGSDIVALATLLSNLTGEAITPAYVVQNMLPRMKHSSSGNTMEWNKIFHKNYGIQYLPEFTSGYKLTDQVNELGEIINDRSNGQSTYTMPTNITSLSVKDILSQYGQNGVATKWKAFSSNISRSNTSGVIGNPALYVMKGKQYNTSPFSIMEQYNDIANSLGTSSEANAYTVPGSPNVNPSIATINSTTASKLSNTTKGGILAQNFNALTSRTSLGLGGAVSVLPEANQVTGKNATYGHIVLANTGAYDSANNMAKGLILSPSAASLDQSIIPTNYGFLKAGLGADGKINPVESPAWTIQSSSGGFPLSDEIRNAISKRAVSSTIYEDGGTGDSYTSAGDSVTTVEEAETNVFDQLAEFLGKMLNIGMHKVSTALSGESYNRILDDSGNYLTYTDEDGALRYKYNGEIASSSDSTSNYTTDGSTDTSGVSGYLTAIANNGDLYDKVAAYTLAASKENEGSYYSVNANDNGSFSVGLKQWHDNRAKAALNYMAEHITGSDKTILQKYAGKAGKVLTSTEAAELTAALKRHPELEQYQYEYGVSDTKTSELATPFKMYDAGELKNPRSLIVPGAIGNTGPGFLGGATVGSTYYSWRDKWNKSQYNNHYTEAQEGEIDDVTNSLLSSDSYWGVKNKSYWNTYIKNAGNFAKSLPSTVGFGDPYGMEEYSESTADLDMTNYSDPNKALGFGTGSTSTYASTIVNRALQEQGTTEYPAGTNKVKYNTEFYGSEVSGAAYPWCVTFPWWVFKQAGASELFGGGQKFASCTMYMNWSKQNGRWHSVNEGDPQPGDIAIMGFGGKDPKHMGIVIGAANGKIQTIEGNTSSSGSQDNGGAVLIKERKKSDFIGFDRPPYKATGKINTSLLGSSSVIDSNTVNTIASSYTDTGTTIGTISESGEATGVGNTIFDTFGNKLQELTGLSMTRIQDNNVIGNASDNVSVGYGIGSTASEKLNIAVNTDGVENKLDILIDVMKTWASRDDQKGATSSFTAKGYGDTSNTVNNTTINNTTNGSTSSSSSYSNTYSNQAMRNLHKKIAK